MEISRHSVKLTLFLGAVVALILGCHAAPTTTGNTGTSAAHGTAEVAAGFVREIGDSHEWHFLKPEMAGFRRFTSTVVPAMITP